MNTVVCRRGFDSAARRVSAERIASLHIWVRECHELYLRKDSQELARRSTELLQFARFLRGHELSMLTNHFAMIKLEDDQFWHALAGELARNGLPDPTPEDVALIADAYSKAHCFNLEVIELITLHFSAIESRLEPYPLSVMIMSLGNLVEYRDDNRFAPRPREGFRSAVRVEAEAFLALLEMAAAWVIRNDHALSPLTLTSLLQGFTKLRYSNRVLYRSLAVATRLLAPEMSFEQVCANLSSFSRMDKHDRRAISALLDRLCTLPEDEPVDLAFLPPLVHVIAKLDLRDSNVQRVILKRLPGCMNDLKTGELIRVLSMLPNVIHKPTESFLVDMFGPSSRCQSELRCSHDQTVISVIVEAANRMNYFDDHEFWELVMAVVSREVSRSTWHVEARVKCFVAVAKLDAERYPETVPKFFQMMEPIITEEIPTWNPTTITGLAWGLLWRKVPLSSTLAAVFRYAMDNIDNYDQSDIYRLIRLMASLESPYPSELPALVKSVNDRLVQQGFYFTPYQCKLVESFCKKFDIHLRSKNPDG
ncbi:hypothetical protein FOL47_001116 [Perkinsus chesapeaki]|uniref:Uncharacterized protein n=1 Tax=Perkinsus chesapeaki TaxID=330153 RepID=A0A7J6MK78_PERCH|nr:hypothetical protein FOL47_001116 [Perkinsus chesapeaki]